MEIAKYRTIQDGVSKATEHLTDGAWVRFGRDILFYSDEISKGIVGENAERTELRREDVSKEELHIVVQNGRLFQKHHPNVTVIHDRGRFLLVKLDPQSVEKLKKESETCFGIMPLKPDQVVFEENETVATTRAPLPFVQSLVNKLNRDELESRLKMLTSFFTRNSTSADFVTVSEKVKQILADMNYQTMFQTITVNGGTSRNIIAHKKGVGAGVRKVFIVTAHLDSINFKGRICGICAWC